MTQGQTFANISIPIINDDAFELTESFSASLSVISPITPRITVDQDIANITIEDHDCELWTVSCRDKSDQLFFI